MAEGLKGGEREAMRSQPHHRHLRPIPYKRTHQKIQFHFTRWPPNAPGTMTASIILLAIAATGLVAIAWRIASRRQSLPCPVWLRWLVELDNPFTKTNRAAYIVETLALSDGMNVLDAGCGPGRLTVPLARGVGSTGSVVALDIQPGMLARARTKTEAAGQANVEFVAAGLGDGQLPAGHFDRAVLVTVLGEIPHPATALAELFAALKPGGVLAVVEVIFDPHFQSRSTVTRLAATAGLRERAFFGHRLAYVIHFEKPEGVLPVIPLDHVHITRQEQ